jgi:hypothetical protein
MCVHASWTAHFGTSEVGRMITDSRYEVTCRAHSKQRTAHSSAHSFVLRSGLTAHSPQPTTAHSSQLTTHFVQHTAQEEMFMYPLLTFIHFSFFYFLPLSFSLPLSTFLGETLKPITIFAFTIAFLRVYTN